MTELELMRKKIDEIDGKLLVLFKRKIRSFKANWYIEEKNTR